MVGVINSKPNAWLLKTNSEGNILWNKTFENSSFYSVQQTSDGGYIIAGEEYLDGKHSALFLKTDSNGNIIWNTKYRELIINKDTIVSYTIGG